MRLPHINIGDAVWVRRAVMNIGNTIPHFALNSLVPAPSQCFRRRRRRLPERKKKLSSLTFFLSEANNNLWFSFISLSPLSLSFFLSTRLLCHRTKSQPQINLNLIQSGVLQLTSSYRAWRLIVEMCLLAHEHDWTIYGGQCWWRQTIILCK